LGIQEVTVPRAFPCNRENAVFEIEMLNEPGLAQAFGNLFGLFVFGFKRIDQVQKNQIGHFDFQGHGAAIGCTGVAHASFVARPGIGAIDVNNADG
jgi:hypothetical protein